MVYDDIVIGSGISALGAILGLDPRRRILVLAGSMPGEYSHYTAQRLVPCAYLGLGGLGNFWHGVIPLSLTGNFGAASKADFARLFASFYPRSAVTDRLRQPLLFVPWRPIRPAHQLACLVKLRPSNLSLIAQAAHRFSHHTADLKVSATDGCEYRCRRLWIAAGAIHTPGLLEHSLGAGFSRGHVSDHALCYVGQVSNHPAPTVTRTRDGLYFSAQYDPSGESLYTIRPARFSFRKLDFGIEQRAVFGMPTGSAVAKIMRRMSPGLLAEALYNRAGLFPKAVDYSIYAQTRVPDAYVLGTGSLPLEAREALILKATANSRNHAPFAGLRRSQRNDLYIPGIHLHDSVNLAALAAHGINQPESSVQVIDASVLSDIGPDHHSFKLMLLAYERARRAC